MSPQAAAAAAGAASAFAPSGQVGDKAKALVYVLIAVLIVAIVIYAMKKGSDIFGSIGRGLSSFGDLLGLTRDPEEQQIDNNAAAADLKAIQTNSPYNPIFYKTAPSGTALLTSTKAFELQAQIWDSVGFIYDSSSNGVAAIKQCRNWAQVSQVCDMFNVKHNKDMYAWLSDKYDSDSQKKNLTLMVNYAFALPKY
jgi:hypothetical protein